MKRIPVEEYCWPNDWKTISAALHKWRKWLKTSVFQQQKAKMTRKLTTLSIGRPIRRQQR
jgi:hypothetical protein